MIIVDTSGLLAYFDTSEDAHEACTDVIRREPGPFILSPLVLAETDYMLSARLGFDAAFAFLEDVRLQRYVLASWNVGDMAVALSVIQQYRDLNIGITDASLAVLADTYGTTRLLTLNEWHFRTVKPLAGPDSFTLLPADG